MNKIFYYLYHPFPFNYSYKTNLKRSFLFGVFVFIFLIIFKPFGLSEEALTFNEYILLSGYGLVTFTIGFLYDTVLLIVYLKFSSEESYKVIHEILSLWLTVFTIGLANAIYSYILNSQEITFQTILHFQFITLCVGIFPVIFFVLIELNFQLKKNLKEAVRLNEELQSAQPNIEEHSEEDIEISFSGENEKEFVTIKNSELLFVKSVGNYIEVYYLEQDKIKTALYRSTLKRIENLVNNISTICKCHRAYLVNMINIKRITGDSQGYKLELKTGELKVPVSRNYSRNIREIINHYH